MVLARDVVGFETRGPVRAVLLRGRRARSRPARSSSRPACPTAGWRRPGSTSSPAAASTTAPTPATRASARATTSTSSGRRTRPARRRSTWPGTPSGWCWWSAAATLEDTMSQYLVERITPRPTSRCASAARWWRAAATATSRRSPSPTGTPARTEEVAASWLFVFIGASPRTDWLGADVVRDDQGFVVTGQDLLGAAARRRLAARRGRRSRWRPACPGCSPPATCGSTR